MHMPSHFWSEVRAKALGMPRHVLQAKSAFRSRGGQQGQVSPIKYFATIAAPQMLGEIARWKPHYLRHVLHITLFSRNARCSVTLMAAVTSVGNICSSLLI
jgi:hypothetical protein